MPVSPIPLSRIASESGFGMADVAFLAGLEESTVSRLWDDPDWLDRVKGRSLQMLIGVVPGIGEYVTSFALAERRNRLADRLAAKNVEVDTGSFRRLVCDRRVPEQYLSNALDTAGFILDGDVRRAAGHLARFWGREQDYALGYLFGTNGSDPLLKDSTPLVEAALAMTEQLTARSNSFHAIAAQANLVHHLSRVDSTDPRPQQDLTRQTALSFRSGVMGRLIATDDPDVASEYSRRVQSSPLVAMVEGWAFPTYTHDAKPSTDFSLPRSLLLRETAAEVVREVKHYNDAYLLYLSETGIPVIIGRDPTFGLIRSDLVDALRARRERVALPQAAAACDGILAALGTEDTASAGGTDFDDQW
jgi:hypothetical protein